jgi:hypothetical protein
MASVGARGGAGAQLGATTRRNAANEERRGGCSTSMAMAHGLEKASAMALAEGEGGPGWVHHAKGGGGSQRGTGVGGVRSKGRCGRPDSGGRERLSAAWNRGREREGVAAMWAGSGVWPIRREREKRRLPCGARGI